jgi:hypothetical protein
MEAAMDRFEEIQGELVAFGDRYGKLGFAVSVLNSILLLIILLK